MRRGSASFLPPIALDSGKKIPIYRQLYEWFRRAIHAGQLRPGQRVPSTRSLASELKVSRIPVSSAYEQLHGEGYFETFAGAGTCVARSIPDDALEPGAGKRSDASRQAPRSNGPRRISRRVALMRLAPQTWSNDLVAFRVSLPALEHFPTGIWAKLVNRHVRKQTRKSMAYGDAMGTVPFREAIAKSYVASALAQKACRDGYKVYYTRAAALFRDLNLARADGSLRPLLRRLNRIDVLVIDDWVMAPLAESERRDFWEIAEDRYWCTTLIVSRCAANRCGNLGGRREKNEQSSAGKKLWKSRAKDALGNRFAIPTFPQLRRRPHVSLDDRDHFFQNPPASIASLRRLITLLRNADHDPPEPRLPSPESAPGQESDRKFRFFRK